MLPHAVPAPATDLGTLLAVQKAAQARDGAPSAEVRIDRLDRCIRLILDNRDEITRALDTDFGARSPDVSLLMDGTGPIAALKFAKHNVVKWMRPERRWTSPAILSFLGAKSTLHYQPKGVVGIISPWNVPIQLVFAPLAAVFAAGNRAMIKPSELTPATSALLKRLVAAAFSPEELVVCTGEADVGKAFSALPFDHLVFTGGGAVARHVMRAAAENLVPLTLELGGKSPVIVSRSADLALAAERIMNGKLLNAGQTCLAPDYILVPEEQIERFVDHAVASVRKFFPTIRDNPDYGAIISQGQFDRLTGYVRDARDRGGRVIELKPEGENLTQQPHRKIAPTLIVDPTEEMAVMQDEIFGPILPILPYASIADALDYINRRDRPLGLYWFGSDREERDAVLAGTTSGGVTINDVLYHVAQEHLPFGGVGPSGFGAYHGREGFLEFSHRKSVYTQLARDIGPLRALRPPYGKKIRAYLSSQLKP